MPPNNLSTGKAGIDSPPRLEEVKQALKDEGQEREEYKREIIWINVILISFFHLVALLTLLFKVTETKFATIMFAFMLGNLAGFGVTGGAHRLWAHRAYKAKLPLQIILLICFSIAGQNTVYDWVRDHRVHHKYSETDADPHNAKRGFFFSHVGWLMVKKHPEVRRRGKQVDMSDILNDPLLKFHRKFFIPIKILLCFIIPTIIPVYCWNESWKISILSIVFVRYIFGLNFTWLVNSAAHIWGHRPYDKRINPSENLGVSLVALGEGWHNYHHTFPWDYKAAELGNYSVNTTAMLLDMFAKIGWAYDLKQPSKELIQNVALKHGDGSYECPEEHTD